MTTQNVSTLKIHKLTQEQYDRELAAGNIDPLALYLTPEDASKNLIAGDNVTITKTESGLVISASGGGGSIDGPINGGTW